MDSSSNGITGTGERDAMSNNNNNTNAKKEEENNNIFNKKVNMNNAKTDDTNDNTCSNKCTNNNNKKKNNNNICTGESEETEEWSNQNEKVPFVGKFETLEKLEKEYEHNESFKIKIDNIKSICRGMRYVKGDGCCFYRAMIFGIFEYFLHKKNEIQNFLQLIKQLKDKVREAGYTYSTIDEFYDEFVENISKLESASADSRTVEEILNDASASNYLVVFARLLVSSHMKLNDDMYTPYITNYATIDMFCRNEVDPMYVEAEHLQVNALTHALHFPIEIIYLDNAKQNLPSRHRFPEESSPLLYLLYRPGHYDIIYLS